MTGSAALDLTWLAEGKLDAAITLSNNPWDMTAGVAIAREAGAVVRDRDGTEHRSDSAVTIAAAPALVETIISLLDQVRSPLSLALPARAVPDDRQSVRRSREGSPGG
ncbi:inositol monophosphatase family protein [Micromonospora echinospora]|uniref:inositol monophosphatase family protein n=1 Tax=Micromonospora echinospora TaxID=1877 RepID=UPI003A8493C6